MSQNSVDCEEVDFEGLPDARHRQELDWAVAAVDARVVDHTPQSCAVDFQCLAASRPNQHAPAAPTAPRIAAAAAATSSSLVTSQSSGTICPASCCSAAPAAAERTPAKTRKPLRARCSAVLRPMPVSQPVINTAAPGGGAPNHAILKKTKAMAVPRLARLAVQLHPPVTVHTFAPAPPALPALLELTRRVLGRPAATSLAAAADALPASALKIVLVEHPLDALASVFVGPAAAETAVRHAAAAAFFAWCAGWAAAAAAGPAVLLLHTDDLAPVCTWLKPPIHVDLSLNVLCSTWPWTQRKSWPDSWAVLRCPDRRYSQRFAIYRPVTLMGWRAVSGASTRSHQHWPHSTCCSGKQTKLPKCSSVQASMHH
eukprot:TRINITY_DN2127_c0_g1_i4.p1 TRINITY_DN2127_c0_g1~~TRINITY_DN2127_c0_g1_i4.p1  ORF type:complete len:371 (+),score=39.68 TRINITY_DN2127_c0_g1_i4:557-1669(+)